jgi:Raf kinase inhibitor-like YbhB/YbcL family protein
MALELFTDSINEKGFFDPRYTCDIDNSSPELRWSEPPQNTAGFALVFEDLNTPKKFAHWVVYNIPADVRHLPTGIPPQETLPNGIRQGLNTWGKLGYAGPCPPPHADPHAYVFRLFALTSLPVFDHRPTSDELLRVITPLVLEEAQFKGRYQRMIQAAS